jgi:DivIVA domain-containing protein
MSLTPDEIRSREFNLADRGYDRAEVRAFLSALADGATGMAGTAGTPWPEAEERLLLVLEAARHAVESLREEAGRLLREVAGAAPPAPPAAPAPAGGVAVVRERLAAALDGVETALGAIDPGAQGRAPSTRPSS